MNKDTNASSRPLRDQRRRKSKQNNAQNSEGQNSDKPRDAGSKTQTGSNNQGQQQVKKRKGKEKRMKLVKVSTLCSKFKSNSRQITVMSRDLRDGFIQ